MPSLNLKNITIKKWKIGTLSLTGKWLVFMLHRKKKYLFSNCEYILYSFKNFKTTAEIIVWGKSEKKE